MNEFLNIVNGKELIVRKHISGFLEKLLRHYGYDFRHDLYKSIIYSETGIKTNLEEKIKNYYDAYLYLLSNHKNPFTNEMLRRFFFIIYGKEVNESLISKMSSEFVSYMDNSPIELAVEFHMKVYEIMNEFEEKERELISLMIMNYLLLKNDIPTLKLLKRDLIEYEKVKIEFISGERYPMYNFFINLISNSKFQDKSYYQNLKLLKLKDIYNQILNDQKMLEEQFSIKHIYLFGSFIENKERIDSDIDILVRFNLDLSREDKFKIIEYLSKYYFNIFHRFIDFMEIGERVHDGIIKEITKVKKIF